MTKEQMTVVGATGAVALALTGGAVYSAVKFPYTLTNAYTERTVQVDGVILQPSCTYSGRGKSQVVLEGEGGTTSFLISQRGQYTIGPTGLKKT